MARLPYADPETASPQTRKALEALPPLNVFRMLANADTAFAPFLQFGGAVLQSLELDQILRELVILQVAKLTNAEYEWVQHEAIARAVGATDGQVEAVESGDLDSESLPPAFQAMLKFIVQFVETERADDETFAAVREHFPPRQIVEAMLTAGEYLMLAKVMTHLDLELDEAVGMQDLASAGEQLGD
ncbi:MAG: carboxymuconolactone decarboxylase family protein [Solirubrobacterales bacterium]